MDGDFTYTVTGTFKTPNGTTGTITGRLEGVVEPEPAGDFEGRLIANPPGCSATRNFSGPITAASLQWTAGSMVRNTCATNPLGFTSLNLLPDRRAAGDDDEHRRRRVRPRRRRVRLRRRLRSSTTTTTMIVPTLTAGTISATPTGTGLASATTLLVPVHHSSDWRRATLHLFLEFWRRDRCRQRDNANARISYRWNLQRYCHCHRQSGRVCAGVDAGRGRQCHGHLDGHLHAALVQPTTYVDRVVLNQDQSQVTATVDHDVLLRAGFGNRKRGRIHVGCRSMCRCHVMVSVYGLVPRELSTPR